MQCQPPGQRSLSGRPNVDLNVRTLGFTRRDSEKFGPNLDRNSFGPKRRARLNLVPQVAFERSSPAVRLACRCRESSKLAQIGRRTSSGSIVKSFALC